MERLNAALERVAPLFDQLPIGVQLIDGAMRYRYLNRVAAEHGKRPREQLLGRTMQECYPGIEGTELFRKISATLEGGEACELENAFEFPEGGQGWFELRLFKMYGGVVITSVDITRRKRLQVHHRHAQRMDAARQLAGGLAHDFNNLLTIVSAYTDLVLRDSNLTAEQRSDLDEVLRASRRATELASRLLALSRHTKGEPKRIDLEGCLSGLMRTLAGTVGHGVSLHLSSEGDLGAVEMTPTALEQVIVSIALNATHAMQGKGSLQIEAKSLQIAAATYDADRVLLAPGAYVEVAIADDGPGIPEATLDEIFDPHLDDIERVGTGLGLAMCWSLVEQAGGTIQVDSQLGAGSTFRIVLPRVERAEEVVVVDNFVPLPRGTRRVKVLVVDDEAAIRQLIARQLESAGHTAKEAVNGADALAQLDKEPFDLVVSDVLMPVMGGIELARQLEQRGCAIPVLLISGYAPSDAPATPQRRWPLLSKPFTTDMLLDAVDKLLSCSGAQELSRR